METYPDRGLPEFVILIVEDEENDVLLLSRALGRVAAGAMVRWVRNGLEALQYLQGDGEFSDREKYPLPRAIFLDLKMPQMSGFELLAWVRDKPELQGIPTIIISGSKLARDVDQAYRLGANMYLVKPTDCERLAEMVKAALKTSVKERIPG